jgi:hypothetical protein
MLDSEPGNNRFTQMFPQHEVAGAIFISICCFFGHCYDRFRGVNKDHEDWFWGYNEYLVIFGVCSFLLLPFVLGRYFEILNDRELYIVFKYMTVFTMVLLPICIYNFRSSLYVFAKNIFLKKISFKEVIKHFAFFVVAVPAFPLSLDYYFLSKIKEYNESFGFLTYDSYLAVHLFIGYVSLFLLRMNASRQTYVAKS